MRVAALVLALAACGPGGGTDPRDPPELMPRDGLWAIAEFEYGSFCNERPFHRSVIHRLYVRTPEDRLWLSWGVTGWGESEWRARGIRCPVELDGSFGCPMQHGEEVIEKQGHPTKRLDYDFTMSGTIVSEERIELTEQWRLVCSPAEDCPWTECERIEHATGRWVEDP